MSAVEIILFPFMLVWTLVCMLWYSLVGLIFLLIPSFLLPKKDVSNEIVLVTGGGCGFGRLFALEFTKLGSTLVIWDIDEQAAQKVVKECNELGGKAYAYKVDVSKSEEVYRTADDVRKKVGDVTILVNNAGVVAGKLLLDTPDHLLHRTIDVNLKSFFWTFKAFAPSILKNNHGHFVSVASLAGYFGSPRLAEYSASKFAVVGFEDSIFQEFELHKKKVYSTIINPFFMSTGMFQGVETSKGRMPILTPEDVMAQCMTAILTNQRYVFIPSNTRLNIFLKSFMPPAALRKSGDLMKVNEYMKGYIGRSKNN